MTLEDISNILPNFPLPLPSSSNSLFDFAETTFSNDIIVDQTHSDIKIKNERGFKNNISRQNMVKVESVGSMIEEDALQSLRLTLKTAQEEVLHRDSELSNLEECLTEALIGKEFAEAETNSMRQYLKDLETNLVTRDTEMERIKLEREEAILQLKMVKQDLEDTLSREFRREESTRALIKSQKELELAYDEAIGQLENWKRGEEVVGIEGEIFRSGEEVQEENLSEENFPPLIDVLLARCDTIESYVIVDSQADPAHSQLKQKSSSLSLSRFSFRERIRNLVKNRPTKSSPEALRSFAIKSLEDDLRAYQSALTELVNEFTTTDIRRLQKLRLLQSSIDGCIISIRLTATKLKAVKSFH